MDVAFCGVVKETGVDDSGLLDFYGSYYKFNLYKDGAWKLYKAMGERKISWTNLFKGIWKMRKRQSDKGISGNLVGEGWIQGGVLVFDSSGTLRYAYEEEFGDELCLKDIRNAIRRTATATPEEASAADSSASSSSSSK